MFKLLSIIIIHIQCEWKYFFKQNYRKKQKNNTKIEIELEKYVSYVYKTKSRKKYEIL